MLFMVKSFKDAKKFVLEKVRGERDEAKAEEIKREKSMSKNIEYVANYLERGLDGKIKAGGMYKDSVYFRESKSRGILPFRWSERDKGFSDRVYGALGEFVVKEEVERILLGKYKPHGWKGVEVERDYDCVNVVRHSYSATLSRNKIEKRRGHPGLGIGFG